MPLLTELVLPLAQPGMGRPEEHCELERVEHGRIDAALASQLISQRAHLE